MGERERTGVSSGVPATWPPKVREMAPTRLLSFPHGLLYGGPDAELSGPEPRDAALGDGFQHHGVDAQAGCVVVLGNAGCRGGLSCRGKWAEFQGFHLLSVRARNF